MPAQIVNPNRRIYDDHMPPYTILESVPDGIDSDYRPSGPCPQLANCTLGERLNEQPEAGLYRGLLGRGAVPAHGFAYQSIVDVNVGPHRFLFSQV